MLENLRLETLGELSDGIAGKIIDAAIKTAVGDLADRGYQDEQARKVQINLLLKIQDGLVIVDVTAHPTLPPYKTGRTAAKLADEGNGIELQFQTTNPDSPYQPTLADHLPTDERKAL